MDNKNKKGKEIKIRCTEVMRRKLLSICKVTGKTITAVIEDLITAEYDKNKKYHAQYYADLEKKV